MNATDSTNWRSNNTGPAQLTSGRWQRPQTYHRNRVSFGVACCRFNNGRPEILLVCKRFSYAYNAFVRGKYNSGNNAELIALFNGMTVEEKLDIRSLNFTQIWYRVWLDNISKTSNYYVAKNKFESTFMVDGGLRLKKLLAKSSNTDKVWEIPKGRKSNKTEPEIHCAIREFREETGIPKSRYKIFPGAKRTYSFTDMGVRYTNTYYLAYMRHLIEPKINFGLSDQLDEIGDIRWMNITDIKYVDSSGHLVNFIRPIFNYMKKYVNDSR